MGLNKRRMILWDGGLKFGCFMFLTSLVIELIREGDEFFPLWPPTFPVYVNWALQLTLSPIISFASGCLFGYLMWAVFSHLESRRIK